MYYMVDPLALPIYVNAYHAVHGMCMLRSLQYLVGSSGIACEILACALWPRLCRGYTGGLRSPESICSLGIVPSGCYVHCCIHLFPPPPQIHPGGQGSSRYTHTPVYVNCYHMDEYHAKPMGMSRVLYIYLHSSFKG